MPGYHENRIAKASELAGAVFTTRSEPGLLRIEGPDRVAFLQRQTTNDLSLLSPDRAVVTVLTSPTARILDVLLLVQQPDALAALTLPGHAEKTARFLQGKIFFMDKVSVSDGSRETFQVDLNGPAAVDILSGLGFEEAPAIDRITRAHFQGDEVWSIGIRGLAGTGYRLVAPTGLMGDLTDSLRESGARPLEQGDYEIARIEAGLAAANHELTEEYTPLETGLDWAVADNKGCYTGQEVIARQLTYDKVTRRLVGLSADSAVRMGDLIYANNQTVGTITSAVVSPRFGPIALAVVRRPHHNPDTTLTIGESEIPGQVVRLPFELSQDS